MRTPDRKKQCQSRNLKSGVKDNFKGESVKLVRSQINLQNVENYGRSVPIESIGFNVQSESKLGSNPSSLFIIYPTLGKLLNLFEL